MTVIAYATSDKDLDYMLENVPAQKYFRDFLDKNQPRVEWQKVHFLAQRDRQLNEPIDVKVLSLEALRAKDEKEFWSLIGDVVRHGGRLHSVKDNLLFDLKDRENLKDKLPLKKEELKDYLQILKSNGEQLTSGQLDELLQKGMNRQNRKSAGNNNNNSAGIEILSAKKKIYHI